MPPPVISNDLTPQTMQPHAIRLSLLFALLGCCLLALPAVAQLTPEHVAMMQSVSQAQVSPDGQYVAYTVNVPRDPLVENGSTWRELYVLDLDAQEATPYITGEVSVSSIGWTPDGHTITFLARREGDASTSLYGIAVGGGEASKLASAPSAILGYDWHPEGTQVALIAREAEPAPANSFSSYQPTIYEERQRNRAVWIADLTLDAPPRNLGLEGSAYDIQWSPDGTSLAVSIAPTTLVDDRYMLQRVHVINPTTGAVMARVENPGKLGMVAWSPDGQHLGIVSAADINDPKEGRLTVVPVTGGATTDILPDFEGHVEQLVWDDAETIRFLASQGVGSAYGTVKYDGTDLQWLYEAEDVGLGTFSVPAERTHTVFVADTPQHPNEVFRLMDGSASAERLTDVNPWLADVQLAPQEVVRYAARDSLMQEGMFIYPLGYQEGTQYPLVMVVHGGPEAHYDNGWLTSYSMLGQMAAANGFAVFYPNYRGSTGRGLDYSKTSQADPAGKEFDDLVDGVDYLIDRGLVDPEKVGVTGGSYGGYATAWLSTRYSDRFAAGVMFVGISNKVSKVGTTDIPNEEYHVHARHRPWDNWQFFLERSPIYYADNSTTPLLIMHGEDDPRVDPGQSHELYRHLKLRGQAPVRLVLYPGEGHGNSRSASRYDYTLRSLRWMQHYLQGPGGEPPPPQLATPVQIEMTGSE